MNDISMYDIIKNTNNELNNTRSILYGRIDLPKKYKIVKGIKLQNKNCFMNYYTIYDDKSINIIIERLNNITDKFEECSILTKYYDDKNKINTKKSKENKIENKNIKDNIEKINQIFDKAYENYELFKLDNNNILEEKIVEYNNDLYTIKYIFDIYGNNKIECIYNNQNIEININSDILKQIKLSKDNINPIINDIINNKIKNKKKRLIINKL